MFSIRATFKRKFFAGLIISIPAIITIVVIVWFFSFVDGLLGPLFYRILGYHVYGIGFISTIVLVFVIGIISTNVFGKKVLKFMEGLFLQIPVFKGLYSSVRYIMDAFYSDSGKNSFKKFVIVEYPRPGTYAFGFLTKENTVRARADGSLSNLNAVYIPTNNLYLGEIVLFKESDIFYTDLSIEEGIKIILSGGIATPQMIKEAGK